MFQGMNSLENESSRERIVWERKFHHGNECSRERIVLRTNIPAFLQTHPQTGPIHCATKLSMQCNYNAEKQLLAQPIQLKNCSSCTALRTWFIIGIHHWIYLQQKMQHWSEKKCFKKSARCNFLYLLIYCYKLHGTLNKVRVRVVIHVNKYRTPLHCTILHSNTEIKTTIMVQFILYQQHLKIHPDLTALVIW